MCNMGKIPTIGEGTRWYDTPYRWSRSAQYSAIGRRLPEAWRAAVHRFENYLFQTWEVEAIKADGDRWEMYNISIPDDEHVAVPAIWVVDFFTPSNIGTLRKSIKKQRWDPDRHVGMFESGAAVLDQSRHGRGPSWWRLAEISAVGAGYSFPDGVQQRLPSEFTSVQLYGVTIGEGVTAVVAYFSLSDWAAGSVDRVLHAEHEPALNRSPGKLAVAEGRNWVTYRMTQSARVKLHQAAGKWLAERCPGVFAAAGESQPIMDLLLLDEYDPTVAEPSMATKDALRAVGISGSDYMRWTSDDLPGLVFERVETRMLPSLDGERKWTIWGQRARAAAFGLMGQDSRSTDRSIGHDIDRLVTNLLARLALSDLLDLLGSQSASARDAAQAQHGKFTRRDLKLLRRRFLTTSLDLKSLERDVKRFNSERYWQDREPTIIRDYTPWQKAQMQKGKLALREPLHVNTSLRRAQSKAARELARADAAYRDILATVASLGASIDAFKVQRYALWIAGVSLVVAGATLWITLAVPAHH